MHFEFLVEDSSGKKALEIIVPNIIQGQHTYRFHAYKGIGRIPKNVNSTADPQKRILLDRLPKLLRGYGKTFSQYPPESKAVVVVVCDLDKRCRKEFRKELLDVANQCDPLPVTKFCIVVEEMESWFLGDPEAIRTAYPTANESQLNSYIPDSICETWEFLADVLYPGGVKKLKSQPYYTIGNEKHRWATDISPHLDVDRSSSPSFIYFRDAIRALIR